MAVHDHGCLACTRRIADLDSICRWYPGQVADAHQNDALMAGCVAFAARPGILRELWFAAEFTQVLPVTSWLVCQPSVL